MPEIGMSVSMSGDGKRSVGHRPQATAPILDSTARARPIRPRRRCPEQTEPLAPRCACPPTSPISAQGSKRW
jgi:hypothetical protein